MEDPKVAGGAFWRQDPKRDAGAMARERIVAVRESRASRSAKRMFRWFKRGRPLGRISPVMLPDVDPNGGEESLATSSQAIANPRCASNHNDGATPAREVPGAMQSDGDSVSARKSLLRARIEGGRNLSPAS